MCLNRRQRRQRSVARSRAASAAPDNQWRSAIGQTWIVKRRIADRSDRQCQLGAVGVAEANAAFHRGRKAWMRSARRPPARRRATGEGQAGGASAASPTDSCEFSVGLAALGPPYDTFQPTNDPHQPRARRRAHKRREHRQITEIIGKGGDPKQPQRKDEDSQHPSTTSIAERGSDGKQQQRAARQGRRFGNQSASMREPCRQVSPFVRIADQNRRVVHVAAGLNVDDFVDVPRRASSAMSKQSRSVPLAVGRDQRASASAGPPVDSVGRHSLEASLSHLTEDHTQASNG